MVAGTQLPPPPPPPPHRFTTDPHPDPKPRPPGCCQLEGVAWLLLVVVVAFACAGAGCLGNRLLWSTWPKFKRAGWSVMGASYLAIAALMATRVVVRQWRRVHSGGRVVSGEAPGHVGAAAVGSTSTADDLLPLTTRPPSLTPAQAHLLCVAYLVTGVGLVCTLVGVTTCWVVLGTHLLATCDSSSCGVLRAVLDFNVVLALGGSLVLALGVLKVWDLKFPDPLAGFHGALAALAELFTGWSSSRAGIQVDAGGSGVA